MFDKHTRVFSSSSTDLGFFKIPLTAKAKTGSEFKAASIVNVVTNQSMKRAAGIKRYNVRKKYERSKPKKFGALLVF